MRNSIRSPKNPLFRGLFPWIVATLAVLIDIGINSDVKWTFISASLLLYAGAVSSLGGRLHALLTGQSPLVRLVVCIFLGFVFLGNVVMFGVSQFGSLPKTIGGGRPELAMIRFSSSEQNLGSALDLPFTNGFYGPVAILLRSEKEILFVPAKDLTNAYPQGMQVRSELVDSIRFLNSNVDQRSASTNGLAPKANSTVSVTNLPTNTSNAVAP